MEKIKILYVFGTNPLGGVGTYLKNIIKEIDYNKFDISFLFFCEKIQDDFLKVANEHNCKIYCLKKFSLKNLVINLKNVNSILKREKIHILHVHSPNIASFIFFIAKKRGIKIRIVHSHSIKSSNTFFRRLRNKIVMLPLKREANYFFGCNRASIEKMFGKDIWKSNKTYIARNGIRTNDFYFNREQRNELRNKFNIDSNTIVIGHVGRFSKEKNHIFLIKLAQNLRKKNISFKMVFIGDGELFNSIKSTIQLNGLTEHILLLGSIDNISFMYNMFDILLLPSTFEGSPLTIFESIANDLPMIISDKVPEETESLYLVEKLPLDNIENWIEKIILLNRNKLDFHLSNVSDEFDIKKTIKSLEDKYIDYVKLEYEKNI